MIRTRRVRSAAGGFSLIELMIAMVLGLTLIAGGITLFSANVRSAELAQAVTNLQAGARFALDTLSTDLRSAGYRGCAAPDNSILSIAASDAPDGLFVDSVLSGSVISENGWDPQPPDGYTPVGSTGAAGAAGAAGAPGAPGGAGAPGAASVPGNAVQAGTPVVATHALVVQYAAAPGIPLAASMGTPSSNLLLDGTDPVLRADDYALVSDCESVDVFRIRALGGSAAQQSVDPTQALSKRYLKRAGYPDSTRVYPLVGALYYVGDTGRDNVAGDDVHALYLQSLPFDATNNPPIELLEGVDQLLLRFGTTNDDGSIVMRSPDDASLEQSDVDLVKIGLLMSSTEPLLDAAGTREFQLAGTTVGPRGAATASTAPAYTPDRRMRVPYDMTIRLRNRNP